MTLAGSENWSARRAARLASRRKIVATSRSAFERAISSDVSSTRSSGWSSRNLLRQTRAQRLGLHPTSHLWANEFTPQLVDGWGLITSDQLSAASLKPPPHREPAFPGSALKVNGIDCSRHGGCWCLGCGPCRCVGSQGVRRTTCAGMIISAPRRGAGVRGPHGTDQVVSRIFRTLIWAGDVRLWLKP
jgi:hypothetical protein